ncbi:uncharacterized protein EV154DRAFT_510756 [Mucor mucedo]|uniref:uncharacterized protein n=1 Tax=Mucor mucedo TaxID=29922 RepID=UPI0022210D46|nr:uncharacterized protein EV154DRAFT_510756 [Mucor mucedo]KAI7890713.1 hypothetical protein EV154DRAFT_510756 [Mucor mucedo]
MNSALGQPIVYHPFGTPAPALPAGWVEHYTPTGQPYWYNTTTHQSSWVFPVAPKKKKQIKKKIPGTHWLFVLTADGYEFYYDRETKTSVWEMPKELEAPLEELKKLEAEEKEARKLQQQQQQQEEEESKKRALEEEEVAAQEAKRLKLLQEEQEEATEMTEEDIMWQLQQMEGQESDTEGDIPPQEDVQEVAVVEEKEKNETKPELSEEERIQQFNTLLEESHISPFAVYTVEYPKLMTDPRFSLVPSNKQKMLFNKYCHALGEHIRQEKAKEAKRPEDEFKELLESKVTTKMYWDDFRRKYKDDARFKALPVTREREALFKAHVKHNLNKKKNPVEEYKALLRNTDIRKDTRWRDAKKLLENHDAYHAIEDKDKREDLFRDYLEQLQ